MSFVEPFQKRASILPWKLRSEIITLLLLPKLPFKRSYKENVKIPAYLSIKYAEYFRLLAPTDNSAQEAIFLAQILDNFTIAPSVSQNCWMKIFFVCYTLYYSCSLFCQSTESLRSWSRSVWLTHLVCQCVWILHCRIKFTFKEKFGEQIQRNED